MPLPIPRFVEAYPVLRAGAVAQRMREGRRCCTWRREDGVLACSGTLLEERPGLLILGWLIHELNHVRPRQGEARLPVLHHSIGKNARPLFSCVSCTRAVSKLVLAPGRMGEDASWKCQSCHGLRYMSSLGGESSSAHQERTALREEVRHGRPKGMREQTYVAKLERLKNLEQTSRDRLVWPDQCVTDPTWSTSIRADRVERQQEVVLSRDCFRYLEAYPRLEAVEARHALEKERSLCVWTAAGITIGNAELKVAGPQLHIRYALQRTREHAGAIGEANFGLLLKGSWDNNKRWLLQCPGCREARSALILVGDRWGCRKCQKLGYRSALKGTGVRRADKVVKLEATLAILRSTRARRGRIARAEDALEAELSRVGVDQPHQANSAFRHVVESQWMEGDFAEDGWCPSRE